MNILITGQDKIAGRLADCFARRGDDVAVLTPGKHGVRLPPRARHISGDIRSAEKVRSACKRQDVVVHAWTFRKPWASRNSYFETNMRGTANVVQGCIHARVKKLVYVSDAGVVFDGRTPINNGTESLLYAKTPPGPCPESIARAEKMVLDANGWEMVVDDHAAQNAGRIIDTKIRRLATCVLRPALLWGRGVNDTVAREVAESLNHRPAPLPRNTLVTVTHIDRLIQAVISAVDQTGDDNPSTGNVYFVGDDEPVDILPWLCELIRKEGGQAPRGRRSATGAWFVANVAAAVRRLIPLFPHPRRSPYEVAQLMVSHTFDLSNAKLDLDIR